MFAYTTDEDVANEWLREIQAGRVGLDTEACPRTLSPEELNIVQTGTRAERLEYLRTRYDHGQEIDWDAVGTCTVQVAFGSRVLTMNLKRMKGIY